MQFEESVINVKFAEILNEYGINCYPQIILPRTKKPDIMVFIEGIRVIIEGRCTHDLAKLEKDAVNRINDGLCEVSVALLYGSDLKEAEDIKDLVSKIRDATYNGSLFFIINGDIKKQNLNACKVDQFSDFLKNIVSILVNQSKVFEIVQQIEKDFKNLFNLFNTNNLWLDKDKSETLIKRIKLILAINEEDKEVRKSDLFYITFFILFDALLFHELIADIRFEINKLSQIKKSDRIREFLIVEWKKILDIDYQPIFSLAYDILKALPTTPETDNLLFSLQEIAIKVLSSGVLRNHDLMGRIYHKLLLKTTGKYYATYYTALPSAVLLSNLIFRKFKFNYDENFVKNFKIIDPACGSGTLLASSYKVLKDIFSSFLNSEKLKEFYKQMIESCIYGIDILDYAAHLTLVTLMQQSPKVEISKTNIFTVPVGKVDNEIEFGSLSYLKSFISKNKKASGDVQQLDMYVKAKSFVKNLNEDSPRIIEIELKKGDFDVVIMNPPFSRSAGKVNIRYGYIDDSTRQQILKEEQKLIERLGFKGIGHAGLGAIFIILADKLLKENGIIGLVLPRGVLSSISWKLIRDYLMKNYTIMFIISNHDPGSDSIEGWNWSENTNLGEIMIVLQKDNKENAQKETIYINLWNKPENELQALDCVFKINLDLISDYLENGEFLPIYINNKQVGTYYRVKQSDLNINWLYPCLFANPKLNYLTLHLIKNIQGQPLHELVETVIRNNRKIFLAGLDRKQIESEFKKVDYQTNYRGIWGQPEWLTTICPQQLHYFEDKKRTAAYYFNQYSSDLLIAERIWTNNSRVISLLCENNILATLFWEVKLKEEFQKYKKPIALWFNSTFGMIQFLAFSINNGGPWFNLKKENLLNLLIPEFVINLTPNELERFNQFFDNIKTKIFAPFPEEFNLSSKKQGTRYNIDSFFRDKNNKLPELDNFYDLLAAEPIFYLSRWNLMKN